MHSIGVACVSLEEQQEIELHVQMDGTTKFISGLRQSVQSAQFFQSTICGYNNQGRSKWPLTRNQVQLKAETKEKICSGRHMRKAGGTEPPNE